MAVDMVVTEVLDAGWGQFRVLMEARDADTDTVIPGFERDMVMTFPQYVTQEERYQAILSGIENQVRAWKRDIDRSSQDLVPLQNALTGHRIRVVED